MADDTGDMPRTAEIDREEAQSIIRELMPVRVDRSGDRLVVVARPDQTGELPDSPDRRLGARTSRSDRLFRSWERSERWTLRLLLFGIGVAAVILMYL